MLKKVAFLSSCLLGLLLFTACETVECHLDEDQNGIAPSELLTQSVWDLQWVEFNLADENGALSWTEDFGEFTDNGICTFDFREDNTCTMIDDENEEENEYVVYEDGNMRIGDELYIVEKLTETVLDLVVVYGDDCEETEEEHMHFER